MAKDEAATVPRLLAQLARQSLFQRPDVAIDVHLVANGCTDDTVIQAYEAATKLRDSNATLFVHDLPQGGKSRSWNRSVHELIPPGTAFFLFVDADIAFVDDKVLEGLLVSLQKSPTSHACSGYPVKDIAAKSKKSASDLFSLAISHGSRPDGAINGSLYLVRAEALEGVWLPDQTPGEDGFLNAMLITEGFTKQPVPGRVISMPDPTHHYRAHRATEFLSHERRMIVGTMINRWIFEHLWSLRLTAPAGPLLREWNERDPSWVDRLIAERTRDKAWVIPNAIMFGRLAPGRTASWWKRPAQLATGALATLLTIPPAIAANRRLRGQGAASTW